MHIVSVILYGQRCISVGGMRLRLKGCDAMERRRTRSEYSALHSQRRKAREDCFGRVRC